MKNEENMIFVVKDESGNDIECEVLFTFESEATKQNYIVYTDNTVDEEGNTMVFASKYNPETDETKLWPIESEEEWNVIETVLNQLQNDIGKYEE